MFWKSREKTGMNMLCSPYQTPTEPGLPFLAQHQEIVLFGQQIGALQQASQGPPLYQHRRGRRGGSEHIPCPKLGCPCFDGPPPSPEKVVLWNYYL